jgi:LacI family transcriptional regulator
MASTIRDVARQAGVSTATVSRTLRDPQIVSPATRERVQRAVRELAFEPSHLGRQLAERRHAANGIVFPDLSGPYYAEVVLGYEEVAAELGRSVLILSTHGREGADESVLRLAGRCDGLVVLGRTVADDVLERLAERGTPLVLLARAALPGSDRADTVNAENAEAAAALAGHLAQEGAHTVTFVGDPDLSPDLAERLDGLQRGADAHGLEVRILRPRAMDETAGTAMASQLTELPDAVACANDELALGLLTALRQRGVDVPGDVLVAGWDDVMAARYAGLTTVRQPMRELGGTAARLLDERIRGRRTATHEVLPTELVVRGTTHTEPTKHPTTTEGTNS